MHLRSTLIILLAWSHLIPAYLTHKAMQNLTALTDDLRKQITNLSLAPPSSPHQLVLSDERDEAEIVRSSLSNYFG